MTVEQWRPVRGYQGFYEVSDLGRVRSVDRVVGQRPNGPRLVRGRVLSPATDSGGYQGVALCKYGTQRTERVHRLVIEAFAGAAPGMVTDHINGDRTDNRLANLRAATSSQNGMNKGLLAHSTTGFKGVTFYHRDRNWRAYIKVDRRQRHLGYYADAESAARAYDDAARELHGEFARLNFPDGAR